MIRPTAPSSRAWALKLAAGLVLALPAAAQAQISEENPSPMLQWFECRWSDMERRMSDYFIAGYGSVWVPPISRAYTPPTQLNQHSTSAGYDTFDRFDLGVRSLLFLGVVRLGVRNERQDDLIDRDGGRCGCGLVGEPAAVRQPPTDDGVVLGPDRGRGGPLAARPSSQVVFVAVERNVALGRALVTTELRRVHGWVRCSEERQNRRLRFWPPDSGRTTERPWVSLTASPSRI